MTERLKAGIYARRSTKDDEDDLRFSRSVQDQLTDCRSLAEHNGWTVVREYPEDATSAFQKKVIPLPDGRRVRRNVRPLWQQMIDDLWHGRIDVLVAYDLDRAVREPRDLEDLIEVVEQTQRYVTTVTGSLSLRNDAEVTMARVGAAVANKSSRDTSRRVKRAAMRRAQEGGIHGSIPVYGYEYVRDAAGRVQTMTINENEAALVREAADRFLAGETLYGIVADFDRRGLRTRPKTPSSRNPAGLPNGGKWQSRTINRILTTPTIAGFRKHDGHLFRGSWEPILDEATWRRIVEMFDERAQTPSNFQAGNARKYALSGLVRCGTCGHTMVSMTPHKHSASPGFTCNGQKTGGCGHMKISMALLEPYVVGRIKAYLSSPAFKTAHKKAMQEPAKAKAVLDMSRDRDALDRAKTLFIDGDLTKTEYEAQVERINRRMAEAYVAVGRARWDTVVTNLPAPDEFVWLWQENDNLWRRTIASAVIGEIRVHPWIGEGTTNVTRRKGENEDAFLSRKARHDTAMMKSRVTIVGRDGKEWRR